MKEMRRVLALVLCLVMLIGIVPAAAFATESEAPAEESGYTDLGTKTAAEGNEQQDPLPEEIQQLVGAPADAPALAADGKTPIDAAIIFSDLHTNSSNYKEGTVTGIMTALKNSDLPFSTVTSCGDAFSVNDDSGMYTGYTSTITGYIQGVFAGIPVNYVWSDHDRYAVQQDGKTLLDNDSGFIYGAGADGTYGTADDGNYYIFELSMADLSTNNRYEADFHSNSEVTANIAAFVADAAKLDKTKPLFIASHQPLLDNRNDNGHALEWCTAINEVAKNMDVAFFFGHNHKYDVAGDYYYAKGSTMSVCKDSAGNAQDVEINFTHMCAGYMEPTSTGSFSQSGTRRGVAVAAVIYEDSVKYVTYDSKGVYNGSYALNETVTRDHAAPKVEEPEEPEVTEQTFWSADNRASVTATATGATLTDFLEDAAADALLSFWYGYDIALEGQVEGTNADIAFWVDYEFMSQDNFAIYRLNEDGVYEAVTGYSFIADEEEDVYVTISDAAVGRYVYGTPNTDDVIPEGAVLESLTVTPPAKTKYFDTDSQEREVDGQIMNIIALESDGMVVVANYTHGEETYTMELDWNEWAEDVDGYTLSFEPLVAGQYGSQTVTVSYGGVSAAFTVWVCPEQLIIEGEETVVIDFDTASITGMVMGKVEDEAVLQTVAKTLAGLVTGTLTVYDFTPTYANGDTALSGTASVTLPIPEGVEHPAVYYVSDDGRSFEKMPTTVNENGTLTFTTEHFSIFTVAENGLTLENKTEEVVGTGAVETKVVYVPVDTLSTGDFLVVNTNKNYALGNNNGTARSVSVTVVTGTVTVNGTSYSEYIENPSSSAVWAVTNGFQFTNDGEHLRGRSNTDIISGTASNWSYKNHRLTSNNYYATYNASNNSWANSSTASNVYLYKKVTAQVSTGPVPHTYSVNVSEKTGGAYAGQEVELTSSLSVSPEGVGDLTGWTVAYTVQTGESKGNPAVIKEIQGDKAILSGTAGTAVVRATYTKGDMVVYGEFSVTAVVPHHYSVELHMNENGTLGEEITEPVALKNVRSGDKYSVWAVIMGYSSEQDEVGFDMGDVEDDRIRWSLSESGIATIDPATGIITFTGKRYGTFQVTATFLDEDGNYLAHDTIEISATDTEFIVPGDGTNDFPKYPAEGSVRFDKTATAVGNYADTGLAKVELSFTGVPYTINAPLDVVLMLDNSTSMGKASVDRIGFTQTAAKQFVRSIVINDDGTYNGNRIYVAAFMGGNRSYSQAATSTHRSQILDLSGGFVTISNDQQLNAVLNAIDDEYGNNTGSYGTDYLKSLEDCYTQLANIKTEGRQQFCVYMSDGIPNVYQGTATEFESTDDIVTMFDVTNRTQGSGTATRNNSYEYEKFSTQMKANGVTVFSVGLGLHGTNSSWSGTSAAVCEQVGSMLLNDISGPAGETADKRDTGNTTSKLDSYFFSVADSNAASDMQNVFAKISETIRKTATDVVVEDKVGDKYTVSFALPQGVDPDATAEGLSDFYIQVVNYKLNKKTHERTDEITVLENFTFSYEGVLQSHTVDGKACSTNCNHVTTNNGVVTVLDGTYFDYKSTAEGEFLTWNADEITEDELALQYIAYLDNSAGSDAAHQVPAGTYYTNEYATLTYDNVYGHRVQQEFPIPQMTWNGAQVSYVFYLVNDLGQPVTRTGEVIPFAEAVYVTDVHTTAVLWNDLENTTGLEAKHLAEDLVPDVYELFDDGARYNIHVYEDETEANLNNHFVITSKFNNEDTDQTNNGKYTTYVFNTKADANKYTIPGTYIANDGKDEVDATTYLCKGDGVVQAEIIEANVNSATNFHTGVYYIRHNDGTYERALEYVAGTTYYTIHTASYTPAEGESQWRPDKDDSYTGGVAITDNSGNITGVYYLEENGNVYTIVRKTDAVEAHRGTDFSNTTVAFAVKWKPKLAEDTVVIDFGLDVVVDVTANDILPLTSGVMGIRTDMPATGKLNGVFNDPVGTQSAAFERNNKVLATATLGETNEDGNVNKNVVRVSLDKDNGMLLDAPMVFYYEAEVQYYLETELLTEDMYSKLTVIPATTVYYEDEYVNLRSFVKGADGYTESTDANGNVVSGWDKESVAETETQAVDRPGTNKMGGKYDADNIYGYDPAYKYSSSYSLGDAAMVNVNTSKYATATFEFFGTGFDIISMTSNTTGTIVVKVYPWNGTAYSDTASRNHIVDTYWGYTYGKFEVTYTYDEETETWARTVGNAVADTVKVTEPDFSDTTKTVKVIEETWKVTTNNPEGLYQVPVMKVDELTYGRYKAEITVSYAALFDHTEADGYDFYLDAIRIYDPCGLNEVVDDKGTEDKGDDVTVGDVYAADGEFAPKYEELRNKIIGTPALGAFVEVENIKTFVEGVMYFTEDAHGNFSEVTKGAEPVPGIVYYTVTATAAEVSEFAKDVDYFTKVENGDFIQVAESEAYNAQKNYYTFVEATIDTFTEGVTYYTEVDHIYTEVPADAVYDSEKTYYTVKYEVVEIDAFAEGVTYYTETNGIYAEVPVDAVYDSEKTYYTVTYEMAEIKPFVEGVTYYTEEDGIYTEVPADAVYDSEKAYYTAQHEKVEDAFAEDVTYYTKDIAYIKTAHVAPVERTTYYTLTPEEAKISQFESGATYFAVDKNDRFTIVTANETPKEDVIYYTMNSGEELEGAVFLTPTFVDGNSETTSIADYTNYGPNNEVYLAAGQAVAAKLKDSNQVSSVHLGIKSVGGNASVEVYGIDSNGVETAAVMEDLSTATDMYYDITNLIGRVIVIRNSGSSGIVSITNVKTAYEKVKSPTNPANEEDLTPNSVNAAAETEASMFTVDAETLKLALLSLSEPIKVEQPDAPEGGEPGGNEPGGEPEGGEPGSNEPGGEPEGGEPGGNEPGGEPEGGEPGGNEPGGEPEGGEPGGNEPGGEPEGGEPGGNEPGGEPEGGEPGGDAPQDPAPSEPVPEETEPEEKESIEETIQDIVEIIRDIIGIIGGMFRGWF